MLHWSRHVISIIFVCHDQGVSFTFFGRVGVVGLVLSMMDNNNGDNCGDKCQTTLLAEQENTQCKGRHVTTWGQPWYEN